MAAVASREVTTKVVSGVSFGFYSDDEIRRISVKHITSPIIFDNLKQPVPDGLYDSALGPVDLHGLCSTCKLNHHMCPGHFGHIELAVPVYHPLVFNSLYKLVRCVCLHCFQFRMKEKQVAMYARRLDLLHDGHLVDGLNSPVTLADEKKGGKGSEEEGFDTSDINGSPAVAPRIDRRRRPCPQTSHTRAAMQQTVHDFFSKIPKARCANCMAESPAIKKEGFCKIFKAALSAKRAEKNVDRGTELVNVLETKDAEGLKAELAGELAKSEAVRAKERRRARKEQKKKEEEGQEDANVFDDEAEEGSDDSEEEKGSDMELDGDESPGSSAAAAGGSTSSGKALPTFMTVSEVREIIKRLWKRESAVLKHIYAAEGRPQLTTKGAVQQAVSGLDGTNMFFLQTVPVAPNRFRPVSILGGQVFEHQQNVMLSKCINLNLDILSLQELPEGQGGVTGAVKDIGRIIRLWLDLQDSVNQLMDSSTAEKNTAVKGNLGIRQGLEKKEGLFRKNMMGKRVNFAARSVISPDPCLGTGEIGVPPYFAKRLSFPERVTPWNVAELRAMVERGPEEHPGAVAVEDEQGRMVYLARLSAQRRSALAKTLLSGSGGGKVPQAGKGPSGASMGRGGGKIVYRQLMDGDLMLTNRQPTLHKPGLMAHRARVLKGERTIRMHYANCATFNADFDGDEINLHLPQDHLGRAEGYHIVHADHQYIVPTDGKPIRGLIQDHIIASVLITKRDTFYTRADYQQLVYAACGATSARKKDRTRLMSLPPALVKPRQLWTGKQVISTVLRNWTRGMSPLTLRFGIKTPADYFGKESQENESNFYQGELVAGIIDKAAFGKHGLVHGIQELYGNTVAGNFMSSLSRLFTYFTQVHGFTCGIDDVRLKEAAEDQRACIISRAEGTAVAASAELMKSVLPAGIDPSKMPPAAVIRALSTAYRTNANTGIMHDMKVSGSMHPLSSEVVKACLPAGQVKRFPWNCMSLMTVTGAKGSLVNFSQISCLLGQQELEGRRTPRMASGKTLPCFAPYDGGARPGGFIGDRFLSGLRPQEYYFHCMAGRDGLVDTTVKTSRSGYLQRCLVKNLEALRVHYDGTVRDDTDGSIVQLNYGEDGLDMLQTSYMMQFPFLAENANCYAQKLNLAEAIHAGELIDGLEDGAGPAFLASQGKDQLIVSAKGLKSKYANNKESRDKWCSSGDCKVAGPGSRLPAMSKYPPTFLGITSERFAESLEKFIEESSSTLLKGEKKSTKKKKKDKEAAGGVVPTSPDGFRQLMQLKYMQSLMSPGEAVGVLAAQSIGEPSTQMTLNTFHMAGRGEANVTMGIPRVREILMTAAKSIKTPVMKLPVLKPRPSKKHPDTNPKKTARKVKELASRLRRIRLAELLQGLQVVEQPVAAVGGGPGGLGRCYHVQLTFIDPALYPEEASVTFEEITRTFKEKFTKGMKIAVKAALRKAKSGGTPVEVGQEVRDDEEPEGRKPKGGGGEDDGEEPGVEPSGAAAEEDENDDDEDHEEGKMMWRSGRHELATYDDGDEEDQQAAREGAAGEGDEAGSDDEDADTPVKKSPKKAPAKSKKAKQNGNDLLIGEQVAATDFMCTTTVTLPLDAPKLLMLDIAEGVAAQTFVRSTPNIEKCYTIGMDQPGGPAVQTDGINFVGAFSHADLVDVNEITCNCVTSMLETFGVEAARATIVQEVRAVFGAYGIAVDPRHLNLIADYMTQGGAYRAMNRVGIETCTSPLLKMSFETAAKFLTQATLDGSLDDMASPASRIMAGRPMQMGTGCIDIAMNLT